MVKLVWLCLLAAVRTAWRRARRGPLSPSWSLGLEISVEAARRILVEMNTWPTARMQAIAANGPPSRLASRVEYSQVSLAGVATERTVVRGAGDGPVLIYIHGGGMVLGSPRSHRDIVSRIAIGAGACAYSLDYRLAPQHPFPAALEDVLAAYRAMLDKRVDPKKLVVAGDSAGGVLTLALLLNLRETGLPMPAAAVAICPAPDLSFPSEGWKRNATTDYLTLPVVRQWIGYYAKPEQLGDPLVSPIHGDFDGFPPMLVQAGAGECLYDEIALLVEKLEAAQVDVSFESYPEMPHVWHLFRAVTPEGDAAICSIAEYIRARTG